MAKTVALIVAAGRGQRFGAELPKQFLPLAGQPLLRHALTTFAEHPEVDAVQAVINPDDDSLFRQAAAGLDLMPSVAGGETRQESVRRGLAALADLKPEKILIHDAARPFATDDLISRVIGALDGQDAVLPAVPVADTLKRAEDGRVTGTVRRDGLWRAQTPQGFRFAEIAAAHAAAAGQELTDDAAVAEAAGLTVGIVEGDEGNFKITNRDDMALAERRLAGARPAPPASELRCGNGFDVHRFGEVQPEGVALALCGVAVPHDRPLLGHSDADVGLHSLTDALLGALCAGDIGSHFPPSEPRWKGADSAIFLEAARDLVAERGGRILHVDVTLICERPKVGPHREAMRARIAEILRIESARVSVKATTTEGLGFTGRREGIAAQATASLELPGL